MKTEQDWVKEWREDSSLNRWRYDELELEKRIKQIQLDAQKHGEQIGWKKGMTDAAEFCKPVPANDTCPDIWRQDWNATAQSLKSTILAARDNKPTP